MPLYQYACDTCGDFQGWQSILVAEAPLACPECEAPAPRTLASPHVRTSSATVRYTAEARNEKSAHEPMIEHRLKSLPHRLESKSGKTAAENKPARPAHRPWMIGH